MDIWIIVRDDGKYVARPGLERSYTDRLEEARRFLSADDAEKERCVENERVTTLHDLMGR